MLNAKIASSQEQDCIQTGTQGTSALWNHWVHHCLPKRVSNREINSKQFIVPFQKRLKLPYPDEEILSGYEEDVSFIRDGFTTWVNADFNTILERHAVDVRKALAESREAYPPEHTTHQAQEYLFDSNAPIS